MPRIAKTKPIIKRIPERDPLTLARWLESAIQAMPPVGDVREIVVGRALVEDTIGVLRAPGPALPIPEDLIALWDDLDSAISRVVTALPHQMTSASEDLEMMRKAFRILMMDKAMGRS